MRAVVDTSALLDGAGAVEDAWMIALERLHAEFELEAPALLAWEAANVAHRRLARTFGASAEERAETLELVLEGIVLVPSDAASRAAAGKLVALHGLSFYDASFLELASRDAAALLVAHDKRLLEVARRVLGEARAMDLDGVLSLATVDATP